MTLQSAKTRAKKDKEEGKSASTQAGEFVKEQFKALNSKKGSVKSPAQAIAIGLSEAKRAGVKVPPKKLSASGKSSSGSKSSSSIKSSSSTKPAANKAESSQTSAKSTTAKSTKTTQAAKNN